MPRTITTAAVLGAGTMGAQIAAHLANAGIAVTLVDVSKEAAEAGLARLRSLKPDPFFLPGAARLIEVTDIEQLGALSSADWVIEAVVESLDVKRNLLSTVAPHLAPTAVVSSNTSAISLAAIAEGRSASFKRRWLGTHFFNPPRYLHLVELIPTADTDPAVVSALSSLLDRRLGKGVVVARDTPGFIANRLGIFGALRAIEAWESGEFTIEEIEAVTGPAIGRPKSATFRTLDLAGLDVFAHVARDLGERVPPIDGRGYHVPAIVTEMIERGLLGVKTGRGFYTRASSGRTPAILALDRATLEYRPLQPARFESLRAIELEKTVEERLRRLFQAPDRAGALVRRIVGETLVYAADVHDEIAGGLDDIDRAMRWGFGWALGPFETWDAIGVRAVLDGMKVGPPRAVAAAQSRGSDSIRTGPLPPAGTDLLILTSAHQRPGAIVRANDGASLVDLGDGVFSVELHSKMNVLGGDALEMLRAGLAHASSQGTALLIGSEAEHFSAGADLRLVLIEAQDENWPAIDALVREFQATMMAIKQSAVPVVAATAGMTLGGGCEVCLHADRIQAAAETYIGLAEAGVGLIPAGGGTKEMLLRANGRGDPAAAVRTVFETIGFATISTSAADGRRLGFLTDRDAVTMNRERLMADAKAQALGCARVGYLPRRPEPAIAVGGAGAFAILDLGIHLAHRAGRISDHDRTIGRKIARVLAGGDLPHATHVSEQHLLDLEREAFVSLCGEPRTLDRIAYTLKTGKVLRN